jgi:NAD(P)H-dependent FMN reductase
LLDLRKLNLPMFVSDRPVEGYPAAHQAGINQLIDACRRAEVMIWASPSYHGTISGALKNALDFIRKQRPRQKRNSYQQ